MPARKSTALRIQYFIPQKASACEKENCSELELKLEMDLESMSYTCAVMTLR